MTRQKAQINPGMVTGLLSICNIDAYILIDPSSTHSYISVEFAKYVNRELIMLDS